MSEPLPTPWRAAATLAVVAALSALLIGLTWQLTEAPIRRNEAAVLRAALDAVLPPGEGEVQTLTMPAAPALGHAAAFTLWRRVGAGQVQALALPVTRRDGYSGDIALLVGIDPDGEVTGVRVLAHRETPGLGDKIEHTRSDWITAFRGRSLGDPPPAQWGVRPEGGAFDAFTGATITPRAVVHGVRDALIYFERHRAALLAPPLPVPTD